MKKEGFTYLVMAALVAVLLWAIGVVSFSKKDDEMIDENGDIVDKPKGFDFVKESLAAISDEYGRDVAKWVERIYRLETRNFQSGQYLKTGSPGMESFGDDFPYGWTTINRDLWKSNPDDRPTGKMTMKENVTGKQKTFLIFPSVLSGMRAVATHISADGKRPGNWFSNVPSLQARYEKDLLGFTPKYA